MTTFDSIGWTTSRKFSDMDKIDFDIEDEMHGEPQRLNFETYNDAYNQLKIWSDIPFGTPPNICPCTNSENCKRLYSIVKYNNNSMSKKEIERIEILEVAKSGVRWLIGLNEVHNSPCKK